MITNEAFKIKIEKFNPYSKDYVEFWKFVKRCCIEGYWVGGKFMPPFLFFYTNLWHIELMKMNKDGTMSNNRTIGKPDLRDIEWEKAYVYLEAKGFSGFSEDKKYHCINEELKRQNVIIPSDKIYVPAREYLRKYHGKNLGKPLYQNNCRNVFDLEARGLGKSFVASGMAGHNYLTDGVLDYDKYLLDRETERYKSNTFIGAIDDSYVTKLGAKIKLGLDNLEGGQQIGTKFIPSPLFKVSSGTLKKELVNLEETQINGVKRMVGTGSSIEAKTFGGSEFKASGGRFQLGIIDEVGFMFNLQAILGTLRDNTVIEYDKFGVIWLCVCEGTKVWTANGNLINIEDLKIEDGIIGWNEKTNKVEATFIEKMYPFVLKECYEITTNTGRKLRCSYDHPILWSNKSFGSDIKSETGDIKRSFIKKTVFKEVKDIKVDDQIAIAEEVSFFGNEVIWEARLVGMLIGDGSYGFDKTFILLSCDEKINKYIDSKFNTVIEKTYVTKDSRVYRETRIKDICPRLRELGIYGQTGVNKTLPYNINNCNKETITELLGGFYDTGGCIHITSTTNKAKIQLSSISSKLLEEVRFLLQKLGIHGSIAKVKPNLSKGLDKNSYYKLVIADKRSLLLFCDNIKLLNTHKQNSLNKIKEIYKNNNFRQSESIKNIRFERVIEIKNIGLQKVYNLTAGKINTYLANGIITHNTGTGGEMDAKAINGVKEVFYSPETFECLGFDDIYEGKGEIGFFLPKYMGVSAFKDKEGITDVEKAKEKWNEEYDKKLKTKNQSVIDKFLINQPAVPSHAFMTKTGFKFPVDLVQKQLDRILSDKKLKDKGVKGFFVQLGNEVIFQNETQLGRRLYEVDFPYNRDKDDAEGCIIIYEQPIEQDLNYKYIASLDPVAHNEGNSLPSFLILKRPTFDDLASDRIVAEYTGRKKNTSLTYEQGKYLLMYYNAKCLTENNNLGFQEYLVNKGGIQYLAPRPDTFTSRVAQRKYGMNKTEEITLELENFVNEWLLDVNPEGGINLDYVFNINLLKELLVYDGEKNCDRVDSLLYLIGYRRHLLKKTVKEKEKDLFYEFMNKKRFVSKINNFKL
jgi:hypothetical protein